MKQLDKCIKQLLQSIVKQLSCRMAIGVFIAILPCCCRRIGVIVGFIWSKAVNVLDKKLLHVLVYASNLKEFCDY